MFIFRIPYGLWMNKNSALFAKNAASDSSCFDSLSVLRSRACPTTSEHVSLEHISTDLKEDEFSV